jgi:hypothetical protein
MIDIADDIEEKINKENEEDTKNTNENEPNENTFENILIHLIEKIDRLSIKNSLKDSLIINRITSDTVEFITISKVAQLIFNNKENMRYIEEKLKEVMGKSVAINVIFENKETYFTRKL